MFYVLCCTTPDELEWRTVSAVPLQYCGRPPAQLGLMRLGQLRTAVVARTVGHRRDQVGVGSRSGRL